MLLPNRCSLRRDGEGGAGASRAGSQQRGPGSCGCSVTCIISYLYCYSDCGIWGRGESFAKALEPGGLAPCLRGQDTPRPVAAPAQLLSTAGATVGNVTVLQKKLPLQSNL